MHRRRLAAVGVITGGVLMSVVAAPASAGDSSRHDSRVGPLAASTSNWTAWQPAPDVTGSLRFCGTVVRTRPVVNKEEIRFRRLPGGNTAIEVRGKLIQKFIDAKRPSHTVTLDASGESLTPNYQIAYKNGDFLYRATGASFIGLAPTERQGTGFPSRLIYTRGKVSILFHRDANGQPVTDVIDRPPYVRDICKMLGRH